MIVRKYRKEDLARLKQLHAQQGFAYPFPDLNAPIFPVGIVGEEHGEVQIGAFLRCTAEAYLLMDGSNGEARERWQALLKIHEAVRQEAIEAGFEEVQCFLPPEVAKSFGRRLKKMGWRPDDWQNFQFNLPDGG